MNTFKNEVIDFVGRILLYDGYRRFKVTKRVKCGSGQKSCRDCLGKGWALDAVEVAPARRVPSRDSDTGTSVGQNYYSLCITPLAWKWEDEHI